MAKEQKTKPLEMTSEEYIGTLETDKQKEEARTLIPIFERAAGEPAVVWSGSGFGFGTYHYRYESGHTGFAAKTGFSPRKGKISLYLFMYGGKLDSFLARLGKHKASVGCVYVNKLADIDLGVLEETVRESVRLLDEYAAEHNWG